MCCLLFMYRLDLTVKHTTRTLSGHRRLLLLLLFNTTRTTPTTSGPPSTGAAIAMDGGVADTTCYPRKTAAAVQHNASKTDAAVQHNAHGPRTPKHGGRYRSRGWTGAWPTQPAILHRPLIEDSESENRLFSLK